MIKLTSKALVLHYYHLSGIDNLREFPSGLKDRRAFSKMATKLQVAIFNHRYIGNRRSFPCPQSR